MDHISNRRCALFGHIDCPSIPRVRPGQPKSLALPCRRITMSTTTVYTWRRRPGRPRNGVRQSHEDTERRYGPGWLRAAAAAADDDDENQTAVNKSTEFHLHTRPMLSVGTPTSEERKPKMERPRLQRLHEWSHLGPVATT